ncbi:MAG TPA: SGNH/GDSL hydrolase family protein [Tepidisphaeraceae bacterium]|jgi:lysophospholipase L1-like esterase|nr:SGNH/GDSL hydrolase family protein [Tepidisphaeraceae bacterium]
MKIPTFLRLIFALILTAAASSAQPPDPAPQMPAFRDGNVILFQGDSITDGNRGRSLDPNHILGHGYQFIIAANFGGHLPERHLSFLNRGVSGNTVADLQKRWDKDTIALKPDLLSILIGVNDLGHGVSVEQYELQYDQLLADTVKALPNVRLVLCEPFGLPVGPKKNNWEQYRGELIKRQAVVEKLGAKYHAAVVHFQKTFDEAVKRAPADYWIWDGVHPTYNGHQLMADEWSKAVAEFWTDGAK